MQDIEWEKGFAIHVHETGLISSTYITPTIRKDRQLYKNRQNTWKILHQRGYVSCQYSYEKATNLITSQLSAN